MRRERDTIPSEAAPSNRGVYVFEGLLILTAGIGSGAYELAHHNKLIGGIAIIGSAGLAAFDFVRAHNEISPEPPQPEPEQRAVIVPVDFYRQDIAS